MKLTLPISCLLFLLFLTQFSVAQDKIISGIVSDQSGNVLPGATVLVKKTKNSTQTDQNGKYSIKAETNQVLIFSFIGMKNQEIVVSSNTVNVKMTDEEQTLKEVVVTAFGIKREKKSLGYAVTTVKSEAVNQKAETDLGRVLSGKVAGVNITATNGMSGSSTNINIRGYNSISGSTQPLFIVDGVPFDSGTNTQSSFLDGNTESSRFLDIDPNSIESVSVLKGLSATVLYGNAGRNGVILISTKNAGATKLNKKIEVTVTASTFFSEAHLPKYQNDYGGGFHQGYGYFYSNWGPRFDRTDNDGISNALQYAGSANNGNANLQHPFNFIADPSLIQGFESILDQPYEYKPYNGVQDFFRTGFISSTSINARGGTDKIAYNLSYAKTVDEGITPGNSVNRDNFGLGGNAKLSNKFTLSGVFNFAKTNFNSPPNAVSTGSGAAFDGSGVFVDLLYTPRSVDLTNIPYQNSQGQSVYYRAGNDIQNPYWTVNNVKVTQNTDRFFGNAGMLYELNDWMKISYKLGLDTYTELNKYAQNKGGVDGEPNGLLRTSTVRNTIWNHTTNLNITKPLSDDINLNANLGYQYEQNEFLREGHESTDQSVFGIQEHFNFVYNSIINSFTGEPIAYKEYYNQSGLYADATFDFNNYLFMNLAGRFDSYSSHEKGNNTLFYPGASVSFIPTNIWPSLKEGEYLNYVKLRVGYGSSAGAATPYNTRNSVRLAARAFQTKDSGIISTNSFGRVPQNYSGNQLANPDLKVERISEFEFGIDSRIGNVMNFNISLYRKRTFDLITDQFLDYATGFSFKTINIGDLKTKGIEIDTDIDIIKQKNNKFKVNLGANYTIYETTVTKLASENALVPLTDRVSETAANYVVQGKPYGVLYGTTIVRDAQGNKVVGENGLYLVDKSDKYLGDPNPDWTASVIPTISYKGFSLSALVSYRHGGDIFSTTSAALIGRGVVDSGICRECTYILPGVKQDGSPNDIAITGTNLGFDTYLSGANELNIFDGTTLRLQELSFGYTFSDKMLEKLPFGNLSISFTGSNLWYKAFNFPDNINYDTNSSSTGVGNGQGIDFITGPTSRRMGLSIKATF